MGSALSLSAADQDGNGDGSDTAAAVVTDAAMPTLSVVDMLSSLPEELNRLVIAEFRVKDIVSLRLTSHKMKEWADCLMPQFARLKLRGHVGDERLLDDWDAEVLLAAHVLNVQDYVDLLVWNSPFKISDHPAATIQINPQGAPVSYVPLGRDNTRIASRQELYRTKVTPESVLWGACPECQVGCCFACGTFQENPEQVFMLAMSKGKGVEVTRLWWSPDKPEDEPADSRLTKAIYARDAHFCHQCLYLAVDWEQVTDVSWQDALFGNTVRPFNPAVSQPEREGEMQCMW